MKTIVALCFAISPLIASEESPYFQVHEDHTTDVFPLKDSHAEVSIVGPIAEVILTQTYTNEGDRPIDATYLFPASTKVAVHGMTMKIGGRTLTAEIQKKEEARKTFEKAKEENKSASLLEQLRPNVFSMNVARILPGDEVRLSLKYSEILVPVASEYEFVVPTAMGPRYGEDGKRGKGKGNPFLNKNEKTPSRFSTSVAVRSPLPIKTLSCPSHKEAKIEFKSKSEASLTLPAVVPDRDFITRFRLADEKIASGLISHQGDGETTFLLQMEPPVKITEDHITPRDFIFVVDVSGSMQGFPLSLAKNVFQELSETLRATDRFNVILFAGANEHLASNSIPATEANIAKASRFLNRQQGGGGTELRMALKSALDQPMDRDIARSVILISDGFISAESEVFDLIRGDQTGTNIFPLGVGSSVNRHLIAGMSRLAGSGEFVVTHSSEAEKAKERLLEAVSAPVLTNIRLESADGKLVEIEPAGRTDLFANRSLSLVGKWEGKENGTIVLKATRGDGTTLEEKFEMEARDQISALPVLWAREKVRSLADYASLTKQGSLVEEVTELGLKYQLLTPFTSFVAVDKIPREDTSESEKVVQAKPLPKGVGNSSHVSGKSSGSVPEPGTPLLMLIVATLLTLMRARR